MTTAPAQDLAPAAPPPAVGSSATKYAALENELALYSPFESPWAENKANHMFEWRLYNLMRVEVRLWDLHDRLPAESDSAAYDELNESSQIVHTQVLSLAADAVSMLTKLPNRAFARLLMHQLETYPNKSPDESAAAVMQSLRPLAGAETATAVSPTPDAHRRRHGGG